MQVLVLISVVIHFEVAQADYLLRAETVMSQEESHSVAVC